MDPSRLSDPKLLKPFIGMAFKLEVFVKFFLIFYYFRLDEHFSEFIKDVWLREILFMLLEEEER